MSLTTKRLRGSEQEPFTLEVNQVLPGASMLLWHLQALDGLSVVARKSFPFTDDFEAYFIYKERLFLVQTPFTNIWVSLLGQPGNETLFQEVETHIRQFNWLYALLSPIGGFRYIALPAKPSKQVLAKYFPHEPQSQAPRPNAL